MSFQERLHDSEILLDLAASDLGDLVQVSTDRLLTDRKLRPDEVAAIEAAIGARGLGMPRDLGNSVGVLRIRYEGTGDSFQCALVRVPDGVRASDHERIHFLWIVFAPYRVETPDDEEFESFGWMLHDERFSASILGAQDPMQILAAYQLYLEYVAEPPAQRRPSLAPSYTSVSQPASRGFGSGIRADFARRWPLYASDFRDGFNSKGLATILFLFFACITPSVAFGGLLAELTNDQIGVVEAVLATAIGGVIYALCAGQPLTLLGTTGPLAIFIGILYELCDLAAIPFLPTMAWVGIWTSLIMFLLAFTNASRFIQWFTRFTDEIFGALIALIFIVTALRNIFGGLFAEEAPDSGRLLAVILAVGTYLIAQQLSRVRQKPLLLPRAREFLADFGPTIAIFTMTAAGLLVNVELEHLHVPDDIVPTAGRGWVVNPFEAPVWVWLASFIVALLGAVLLFMDQNITVRLVNAPQHRLRKGDGYNLDMAAIALLVLLFAFFGLPWVVAATVRSLNHVRSLATLENTPQGEHIISVRENRLTGLMVHALIGLSLFWVVALQAVPMSVLFGLFLFMGISSTRGNQFIDRLKLWVTDPSLYPPTHYIRRVPRPVMHAFTALQVTCLGILWIVKISAIGVVFPLLLALLVPIRSFIARFFDETHLAFLDADENPEEEMYREMD